MNPDSPNMRLRCARCGETRWKHGYNSVKDEGCRETGCSMFQLRPEDKQQQETKTK